MDRPSMKRMSYIAVFLILLTSMAAGCGGSASIGSSSSAAGSVLLNWNPVITNDDGSPMEDMAYYKVHIGPTAGVYTSVRAPFRSTQQLIEDLPEGETLYFAVSAVDTSGNESNFSSPVSVTVSSP